MVGNIHVFIAYFCICFPIKYCFVLCMLTIFTFSLLLNYVSFVKFYVSSLLNIIKQTAEITKKTVGESNKMYDCNKFHVTLY